jgi:transcriptional regulator with XRE-family HTH domain
MLAVMGTPLGDFIRVKRDSIQPEQLGLPDHGRRRSPGLRRSDVAVRAGISVEYLTRIEQGRDRNPSVAVLHALGDALALNTAEREHLRYLAKVTGDECTGRLGPEPARREVRPSVLETLRLLEPGIAVVTNRLGDLLAWTAAYEALADGTGLLEGDAPNLTRYVFTDARARTYFADWETVADEQAFDLWQGPTAEKAERLAAELAPAAGPEFAERMNRHKVPERGVLRLRHPTAGDLRLRRELLELASDAQLLLVLLPDDEATAAAVARLREQTGHGRLRAIS